jgi:hypothetical protein
VVSCVVRRTRTVAFCALVSRLFVVGGGRAAGAVGHVVLAIFVWHCAEALTLELFGRCARACMLSLCASKHACMIVLPRKVWVEHVMRLTNVSGAVRLVDG